ncbi:hypothetical transmembrane protein [Ralstonia solanacearum IPO1609]|uniref:Hypothetical transmembrane protein n=1 Tax=Ralstonia solanacearum IPO1609 TaxID=564066 RepID=A0ABF7RG89_RALSL|nr:hypothetical transmembrane protein [Ralstonia solanacearum IPO1609]
MSQSAAFPRLSSPRLVLAAGAVALAALGLGGCSSMGMGMSSAPSAVKVANGTLTDAHGMTLYTFDRDTMAGKSACNGNCANNWPPLTANDADKASGDYTINRPRRREASSGPITASRSTCGRRTRCPAIRPATVS